MSVNGGTVEIIRGRLDLKGNGRSLSGLIIFSQTPTRFVSLISDDFLRLKGLVENLGLGSDPNFG